MIHDKKTLALTKTLFTGAAVCGLLTGISSATAQSASLAQPSIRSPVGNDEPCGKLAAASLGKVVIISAVMQVAKAPVEGAMLPSMTGNPGAGVAISGLPAFCRVVGSIHPEAGSDIKFEVWLPTDGWSGRMMGVGNGGLAGSISYIDLAAAVKAGQAGAATDTGHSGSPTDSSWAKGNPARVRDYGWRAMHLTTVAAKKLVQQFYGRAADHSYFASCSNGGRMGLMEASRFPDDYDGILAGAPASSVTKVLMTHIWLAQAQLPAGAAFRADQIKLLQREVLAQCDGIDRRVDGVVNDPRQCKFDAAKLACATNKSAQCFTPPQLIALKKINDGPNDSVGRQVAFGFMASGSEVGVPMPFFGWDGSIAKGDQKGPIESAFPNVLVNLPPQPIASDAAFDFNKDPVRVTAALSAELDPKPDLSQFFGRGGKLIMWHGWADATLPPQYTLSFHKQILETSGTKAKAQMRLFMVPGVQHCFGGPGPDLFGQLGAPLPTETPDRNMTTALVDWVEKGRTPETLVGRLGFAGIAGPATGPEKQRLICAYPAKAVLKPDADADVAANYKCRR